MSQEKIKVLLVDDHEMVRMGLSAFLSTDEQIEIVGQASNGKQGSQLAMELKPDIVLMDLVMEEMNGIEATKKIMNDFAQEDHDIKIIILTSFIEEDMVMPAIEAGAFSYLLKTSKATEILKAVKMAYEGESVLEGKVSRVMIQGSLKKSKEKHHTLTQREMEVLKEIGKGKTNKEISQALFIGIKTVKTHVSNILSKLELEDRTKLALYANKHNLCE